VGIGCERNAPAQDTPTGPTGATTLQPIAEYYLGSKILEPSGIAYNSKNNSFFVVSDAQPEVFEINSKGILLNTIATSGSDLEGIALTKNCDTIYVVEEKNRLVTSYLTSGIKISSFSVDVATVSNNALEGITIDRNGFLYVLNEKLPGMLLEYRNTTEIKRMSLALALDYSDIYYDEKEDCFWIISDESEKVMKTDKNGSLLSQWSIPFSKGEGITIVRDTMYIVNDTDAKLYIFNKPK
jgi:uncharacterized protein YjiK